MIRSDDNVANGYIKLDPKGGYIDCGCCGIPREPKQIAMRRPFDPRNFNDHTQCKTHREKLAMAKHHDMVVARDSNKARQEGREPQAQPKIYKQKSLLSMITQTSQKTATGTSRTGGGLIMTAPTPSALEKSRAAS